MKKLMILAGAALMGASVYAGAATWTISNVYKQNDSANRAATGTYEAFFFFSGQENFITAAQMSTYLADTTKTAADKLAYLDANCYRSSGLTGSGRVSVSGVDFTGFPNSDASAEPPIAYTGYSVVIDGWTVADEETGKALASHAIVGPQDGVTVTSVGSSLITAWNASTVSQGTWTTLAGSGSVPEPTSAMLLLLGVAGLALRRKQA